MKKQFIIFLVFCSYFYSYTQNDEILNLVTNYGSFEDFSTKEYSIAYSKWHESDKYKGTIFLRLNYGSFDIEKDKIDNHSLSLAYENQFSKNLYKNLYGNLTLGFAYGFLDYKNNSLYFSKLYSGVSLESKIKQISINFGLWPELLIFNDKTTKGEQNNLVKKTNLGYSLGLGLNYYF